MYRSRRSPLFETSAAYLKFLHHKRRILFRNFKWKTGTGIMDLLVPITLSEVRERWVLRWNTNFGKWPWSNVDPA
jgi:hypothetical protein